MKGVFQHWMRDETGNFRLVVSTLDFVQKNENTEISRLDVYQLFTGKNYLLRHFLEMLVLVVKMTRIGRGLKVSWDFYHDNDYEFHPFKLLHFTDKVT